RRVALANALPITAIASNKALFSPLPSIPLIFNRSLDSLSSALQRAWRPTGVLPTAAERRDRLRVLSVRLQDPQPVRGRGPARRPGQGVHGAGRGTRRVD